MHVPTDIYVHVYVYNETIIVHHFQIKYNDIMTDIAFGSHEEQYRYEHMRASFPIQETNSHQDLQCFSKSIHNFSTRCLSML